MTPHQFLPRSSATREEEEPQQRDAICILLSKKLATGEGISLLSWVEYWCTRSRTGSDSTGPPVPARASWLQHAHTSALAFHLFLHYGLLHRKKKTHKRLTFDRERNGRTRKKGGKLGRLATRKVIKAKGRLVVELARSIARWRKAGEKGKKRASRPWKMGRKSRGPSFHDEFSTRWSAWHNKSSFIVNWRVVRFLFTTSLPASNLGNTYENGGH